MVGQGNSFRTPREVRRAARQSGRLSAPANLRSDAAVPAPASRKPARRRAVGDEWTDPVAMVGDEFVESVERPLEPRSGCGEAVPAEPGEEVDAGGAP
jgi:hypothetical protein